MHLIIPHKTHLQELSSCKIAPATVAPATDATVAPATEFLRLLFTSPTKQKLRREAKFLFWKNS